MRNPDRLDAFYKELCEIHKTYFPDWRFGQLMTNILSWYTKRYERAMYYPEENEMLQILKTYLKENGVIKE